MTFLNNDSDPITIQLESKFLQEFKFEKCNAQKLMSGKYHTVVHSRTKKSYYGISSMWSPKVLTIGDFEKYFSSNGHTLTIDTVKSYAYFCALDLDCVACKNKSKNISSDAIVLHEHLNEAVAEHVRLIFEDTLIKIKQLSGEVKNDDGILTVLFKRKRGINNCGFHIYSNLHLSAPFNAKVRAQVILCLNEEFTQVAIDSPSMLPLPYSAKECGEPYVPYLIAHDDRLVRGTTVLGAGGFYDNFRFFSLDKYSKAQDAGKIVATIESTPPDATKNRYVVMCKRPYKHLCMILFPNLPRLRRNEENDNNDNSINVLRDFLNSLRKAPAEIANEGFQSNAHLPQGPSDCQSNGKTTLNFLETDLCDEISKLKRRRIECDENYVAVPKDHAVAVAFPLHQEILENTNILRKRGLLKSEECDERSKVSEPKKSRLGCKESNVAISKDDASSVAHTIHPKVLKITKDPRKRHSPKPEECNGWSEISEFKRSRLDCNENNLELSKEDTSGVTGKTNHEALESTNDSRECHFLESEECDDNVKSKRRDSENDMSNSRSMSNLLHDHCSENTSDRSEETNNPRKRRHHDSEEEKNQSAYKKSKREDEIDDDQFLCDFLLRNEKKLYNFKRQFDVSHINSALGCNEREIDDGEYVDFTESNDFVGSNAHWWSGSVDTNDYKSDDTLGVMESLRASDYGSCSSSPSSLIDADSERISVSQLQEFITISANLKGGLSLQHYLVALQKCLRTEEFERFKRFVNLLYANCEKKSIKRLLKMFSPLTVDCYNDSYECILHSLGIEYKLGFQLEDTVEDRIVKFTLESLQNELQTTLVTSTDLEDYMSKEAKNRDSKESLMRKILCNYIEALSQLRFLVTDNSIWYMYREQGFFAKCDPAKCLPWISRFVKYEVVRKEVESKANTKFSICGMWSKSYLMFVTNVGIFNAITGLYATKTTLLRFSKQRNYALWPPLRTDYFMRECQNEIIVIMHERAARIVDIFYNKSRDIYLHFQIIPAILDLNFVYSIGESSMIPFINKISEFDDLSPLNFIVNFFHIQPKFICLVAILAEELIFFRSYRDAVDCCFGFARKSPSVVDWKMHFEALLEGTTFDVTLEDHMSILLSISNPKLRSGTFSTDLTIYCTVLAVCLIKSWPTYRLILEAIVPEYANGDLSGQFSPHHSFVPLMFADSFDNDRNCFDHKILFKKTIHHIFGSDLLDFDQALIDTGFVLCMSVDFKEASLRETLMSVSFVFTAYNMLKKLIVFYGPKNTGKSLISDLIQEMCLSSVSRINDLREANCRANISVRSNVVLVNEMRILDPTTVKTNTGNDQESSKVFFKQEYELLPSQAPIYGATNNFISFRVVTEPRLKVDRITVNRLHAIVFRGKQIQANDTESRTDSTFTDAVEGKYPSGILKINKTVMGSALAWLAFVTYFIYRDKQFQPILDVSSRDVLEYQHQVYLSNNPFYAFIFQCDIVEEPGFVIEKTLFMQQIKSGIDEKTTIVNSIRDFKMQFKEMYGILIDQVDVIENFHIRGFVEHVHECMQVEASPGSRINRNTLEKRLEAYGHTSDRQNARSYFMRHYVDHYDRRAQEFFDIRFVYQSIESYADNRLSLDYHPAPSVSTNRKRNYASFSLDEESMSNDEISVSSYASSYAVISNTQSVSNDLPTSNKRKKTKKM